MLKVVNLVETRTLIARLNDSIASIFDSRGKFTELLRELRETAVRVDSFSDLEPIPDEEVVPVQLRGRTFARVVGRHFTLREENRLLQVYYLELFVNPENFVPVFIVGSRVHSRNRLYPWGESIEPQEPPKPQSSGNARMKRRKRS